MKNIIPVILVGTSLLGGVNFAYAAKTDSSVWADSDSKEWGNTPESVKYVLSNVQISRSQGSNGSNKQTDLFSTKWLKEMQRSPSTYRLSESDKKWVDNVLANAEAKNSSTWKPSNKTPTAPKPKVNKTEAQSSTPKAIEVAKQEQVNKPVPPKAQRENNILPSGTGLTKEEMQKQVNKMAKSESNPLPAPKIEAKDKPDLTPVKQDKKEVDKVVKEADVKESKIEDIEKPVVSEMDAFIASLPVINSEDLPISEIDQTKEEMADFREMYSEARIQKAMEDEELNQSYEEDLKDVIKDDVNQALKNDESISDVKPFEVKENNHLLEKAVSEKTPIVKDTTINAQDNSWITSALSSLIAIAIFMFGIVLYVGRKLKINGKLEKYI